MPLDPQVQKLLNELKAAGGKPPWEVSLEEVRAAHLARRAWSGEPAQVQHVEDFSVPGAGGPIPVRLYRHGPERQDGPGQPVLIWYHGGGFVSGSIEGHDPICRLLAVDVYKRQGQGGAEPRLSGGKEQQTAVGRPGRLRDSEGTIKWECEQPFATRTTWTLSVNLAESSAWRESSRKQCRRSPIRGTERKQRMNPFPRFGIS